ncbi:hypothetical protein D3C86_1830370 [compost metagenome]
MRTYFNVPELSAASVPPYLLSNGAIGSNPSIPWLVLWLFGALPKIMIPPKSPARREPVAFLEVNTIGAVSVP